MADTHHARGWDLWVDYHRRDGEGLTHASVADAVPGVAVVPGRFVVVGNEDADSAVAEIVRVGDDGIVFVRVLPGSVDDNRHRLETAMASPD